MTTIELTNMLKDLIPAIKGNWFLGDGGLLGIKRDNKLLEWDDDLDLYLLPNSYIDTDILSKNNLNITKYYLCDKIYNEKNEKFNKNKWIEYLAYKKLFNQHLNRAQLCKLSAPTYDQESINIVFTRPNIDIFYLKKEDDIYKIKNEYSWGLHFTEKEIDSIDTTNVLGFPVNIPYHCEEILCRQYGNDWKIEQPEWKYF